MRLLAGVSDSQPDTNLKLIAFVPPTAQFIFCESHINDNSNLSIIQNTKNSII